MKSLSGVVLLLTAVSPLLSQVAPVAATNANAKALAPITVTGEAIAGTAEPARLQPEVVAVRRANSVDNLTTMAPNFTLTQGTSDRQPQFNIRGLRDNNLAVGEAQGVVYLDDVPYDDILTRGMPLYGLDSVELYRGPQGTRFGSTGPGGVLDLHSHLPGDELHGSANASYGSWQTWQADAGLSGPILTNTLQAGVSGFYFNREGFVRNTTTGDYGDSRETFAGRAQLRWTPTDRLEFLFTASGYKFDDGLQAGSPLGQDPYTVSRNFDGYDRQQADVESLRATYLADGFRIVSISSHSGWRESLWQDSDYMPFDIAQTRFTRKMQQWREELRVESANETSPWHWRAGAFAGSKSLDTDQTTSFTQPFPADQGAIQNNEDRKYALFGEATREIGDQFELTGGVRFETVSREASGVQTLTSGGFPIQLPVYSSGSESFNSVQPRAELAWKPGTQSRVWLGVGRGFQPGGFVFNAAPAPTSYTDSDSWHYELGAGIVSADGKYSGRVTGFYNDMSDYQVFRPTGFGSFAMLNADRAHTVGAEIELSARPDEHWRFTFGGGFVSAKFDTFTDPNTLENFADKDINLVPAYTLDASVSWHPDEHWFAQVGGQVVGQFYFDEANTTKQSAYGLLNLRAGWQDKHWGVAFFARNALDKEYAATGFHFNQPGTGDFFVVTPGEPAVFGVELSARF